MVQAYENALQQLGLPAVDDARTQMIAKLVFEAADSRAWTDEALLQSEE
jgi:hypothetical protein